MVCDVCGFNMNEGAVVCPQCERVIVDPTGLKRKAENRPAAENKFSIVSQNFNGTHIVKQLSDGSFACTCPSFLLQQGTQNGVTPFMTCKHIRQYLANNPTPDYTGREPSDWQRLLLRTLGTGTESLSNAQAYYLVSELLQLRGVSYPELTWFLKNQKKPNLLPLIPFGVEIEGGIRNAGSFRTQLAEAGYEVAQTGYTGGTRGANEWRISSDASVRAEAGYTPIEFVTPKLLGARGLDQLGKALNIWNDIGANHTASAGVHVHLDGYEAETEGFRRRLAFNYAKVETQYLWFLVAPSRRRNTYCSPLDLNYFTDLRTNLLGRGSRYYSLNFNSLLRHGTVEIRLMNCTTDYSKLSAWVILLLRLYEATIAGLTYDQIPDGNFEGFLATIGFNENACSALQRAKATLVSRYEHWKRDAEGHPNHMPAFTPVPLDNIESIARIRALSDECEEIERVLDRMPNSCRYTVRPNCVPAALWQLAVGNTQREVEMESIVITPPTESGIVCLMVDGRSVMYNPAATNNPVICTCSYARRNNNHCYHARWAARWLVRNILRERLSVARAELQNLQGQGTPAPAAETPAAETPAAAAA